MYKTQEKYRYQQVYANQCVNCKLEQAHECTLALYKNEKNNYECYNYKEEVNIK
jgi:hypothetical protein